MTGLVNSSHMHKLYEEARAYEAYSIRFWNPILNGSFPFSKGWTVSPEQFVHLDTRNGYQKVDTLVEWFDEHAYMHIAVMVHEAKREGQNVTALEAQALGYARDIIKERSLQRMFVITTRGTTFRLWTVESGADAELCPYFGPDPGDKSAYLDAATEDASQYYNEFVTAIKSTPKLLRAPTLPSQAHLLPTFQSAYPGEDTAGPSSIAGTYPGYSAAEPHGLRDQNGIIWVEPKQSEKYKDEVHFPYGDKRLHANHSLWKRNESGDTAFYYCKKYDETFGWKLNEPRE